MDNITIKSACLYEFNDGCIDWRPDGITCFSYSHCLNVRSGNYYNNAISEPKYRCNSVNYSTGDTSCLDYGGTLPQTGAYLDVATPMIGTIIVMGIMAVYRMVIK